MISSISQGPSAKKLCLNMTQFNLHKKLCEIIRLFEVQCKHKGLDLRFVYSNYLPHEMYGDRDRVGQVIINFLSNALKFTSKGEIVLSVMPSMECEGWAIFSVKDTGIGIKEDHIDKLFSAFGKLDAREHAAMNPQGVGLGLMISNTLALMMGSKRGIEVTSVYQQGSEFYFELPTKKENSPLADDEIRIEIQKPKPRRDSGIHSPCECRRVLSVEDNDYNQMVIERMMKKLNFGIVKAFNGEEALQFLKEFRPENFCCERPDCTAFSLIITDLQMPIMNGIDFIKNFRILPERISKLPIILLSATDESDKVKEGYEAGMNNFIAKPLTEESLKKCLKTYRLIN
eukprot:TRINITY_DN9562_c0_g1_i3.p2 TRINITY_DN9562_c0_g1~~TRINITY_DN9562_c0_g1_i3.p2  ORF type:complete len:344 (-),score=52.34 TRINITY_DN9562_c0_g1_i3:88-1119(-)